MTDFLYFRRYLIKSEGNVLFAFNIIFFALKVYILLTTFDVFPLDEKKSQKYYIKFIKNKI